MLEMRPPLWSANLAQAVNSPSDLCPLIDHTCLDPLATEADIESACEEALRFSFASVCVSSRHIQRTADRLKGQTPLPIAVIGFPLGSSLREVKLQETELCLKKGAKEIDMVLCLGDLRASRFADVESEIAAIVKKAGKCPVKVILETSELSEEEIRHGCLASLNAGAKFVKTSTGFASGGATIAAVQLMAKTVGQSLGVKASGGIRSFEFARDLVHAGANRIGTSHGVKIISGLKADEGY